MYGIIDVEKSNQAKESIYLFFMAHPAKCAGTKLITEIQKHKQVGVHPIVFESTHTTPEHIINTQPALWKRWGHLPLYCMTRHPYERFPSQMGFVPIVLAKWGPQAFLKRDQGLNTSLARGLFECQWNYMSFHGKRLNNLVQIKLEDVTGTVFEIEGLEIDMRNELWTQKEAYEAIDITGYPQYTESTHSKEFVQEAYPNDFENLGYHK
tara:strand:+ start:865 stop:1491 length:627 start_codon:yes stop_codon:yes gene_type:complete